MLRVNFFFDQAIWDCELKLEIGATSKLLNNHTFVYINAEATIAVIVPKLGQNGSIISFIFVDVRMDELILAYRKLSVEQRLVLYVNLRE